MTTTPPADSADSADRSTAAQADRLQLIGRLAGRTAHDIGNVLAIVSNNARLLRRDSTPADRDDFLAAILRAVDTGSTLTRRLAALARPPRASTAPVDLERFLPDIAERLHELIGPGFDVSVRVAAGTSALGVDAAELETALLHLALDVRESCHERVVWALEARDADDNGGAPRVTIRSSSPPGTGTSVVRGFCERAGGTLRVDAGGTLLGLPGQAHHGGRAGHRAGGVE